MPPQKKSTMAPMPSMAALHESLQKTFGPGRIVRREEVKPYTIVSTGLLGLDMAMVTGGIVVGRTGEIVGVEGVGKTTLAINMAVEHQVAFPTRAVAIIDMEGTFDYDWAEAMGLDTSPDRFIHAYPEHSEDVSDIIKRLIGSGLVSMVWVDSIGGMENKKALEMEAEEFSVGRNAQIISKMVKNCAGLARTRHATVVFVNQLRAIVGNPQGGEQSAGPKALKYNTSWKLDVRRGPESPQKQVIYGSGDGKVEQVVTKHVRVRVSRSKFGPEGRHHDFWINSVATPAFGPLGLQKADDAIVVGLNTEVIRQDPGGYFWVPSTKDKKDRIRGRDSVVAYLKEHPEEIALVREGAVAKLASLVAVEKIVEFDMEPVEAGA